MFFSLLGRTPRGAQADRNRNKRMAKIGESQALVNNISQIGAGTEIQGEINCAGDLRIDGVVTGTVVVKGKVVIGDAGRVEGEVSCKNGDISGYMKGKIKVLELLALKGTSRLEGDITTKKLSIEPGAVFSGTCQMGEAEPAPRTGKPNPAQN